MRKNIFLLLSTLLFVFLFYNQEPGLNFSIFSTVVWIFLFLDLPQKKRGKTFWILSLITFMATISFAWYADFISFIALFIALLFTGYKAYYPKLNILTFPFAQAYNYASFLFRAIAIQQWLGFKFQKRDFSKKLANYVLIPAFLIAAFLLVYNMASNKFASLFNFNWQLNSFEIVVLTILGFFFMFCFFYYSVPKILIKYNGKFNDDFSREFFIANKEKVTSPDIGFTRRGGEISFFLLNALLIFFIITYSVEQFSGGNTDGNLSSEVHERVYVLIVSIVMAIAVIMGYFKGVLNFDKKAGLLKGLCYGWIGLNTLLLLIVMMKNIEYVNALGLTFKRVGVFIFLILSLAGLLVTYYKLSFKKTNCFLLNRMVWILFSTLIISSMINWSGVITRYNLSKFKDPDWDYLYSLHYNHKLLYEADRQRFLNNTETGKYISAEKEKSFLSSSLYYLFLDIPVPASK